jgi:hypothetical protein
MFVHFVVIFYFCHVFYQFLKKNQFVCFFLLMYNVCVCVFFYLFINSIFEAFIYYLCAESPRMNFVVNIIHIHI